MAKKLAWPAVKFISKRVKAPAGLGDTLNFGWELDYYEFLHKWNGGVPLLDSFKITDPAGDDNVARVRYFYGVSAGEDGVRDLCKAIVHNWDFLPRGAVPIGELDIDDFEFDLCTLLTFRRGDRFNQIYFFNNPHDFGPLDPDDPSRLQLLSRSLPQFLKSLKPFEYFCYRVWFQLAVEPEDLPAVERVLRTAGAEDFDDESSNSKQPGVARLASIPAFKASASIVHDRESVFGVPLPQDLPINHCYLAIDAHRWRHAEVQKLVRDALKRAGIAKSIKKVGETAVAPEPYWRR